MKVKNKWILVGISVLLVLGLLIGSVGCPSPSTVTVTEGGGTATTVTVTPTADRAQGRTDVPWDSRAYFPIDLTGKKVDMTYVLQAHPIWLNFGLGLKERNEQVYGMDISYFDANLNAQTLSNIADGSISRNVDLAMISPIDAVTGSPVYERLHAAGIPVMGLMTATDYLPDITLCVDWYAIGLISGEWLGNALNGTGEVGIVVGDFTTPSGVGRVRGFEDALAKFPNITIVSVVDTPTGPWTRQGAYDSAKGLMSAYPNLAALIGVDDEMGVGCALAVKDSGKKGEIKVVATQGSNASMQAIVDGDLLQMTIYSPYALGQLAADAAAYMLSSPGYRAGTMQGVSWPELISVTKDNVNSVLWPPL